MKKARHFGLPSFGAPLFQGLGLHPSSLPTLGPNSPGAHPSGRSLRGTTLRGPTLRGSTNRKRPKRGLGHPLRCPPFGHHSSGPLRGTSFRRTAQNFALFALSRPHFRSFSLSLWGSSRGILVVFEAPGPSNVPVWAHGLSCETGGFCKMWRTLTIDLLFPLP